MIARLLAFLTGGALERIGGQLKDAYIARKQAETDEQRLEADLRILLAEQGNGITRWIRPAIAFPFVAYLWKVVLWDKVFALGSTDPLSAELGEMMMVMVGAYFLTRPFEKLVRSRGR